MLTVAWRLLWDNTARQIIVHLNTKASKNTKKKNQIGTKQAANFWRVLVLNKDVPKLIYQCSELMQTETSNEYLTN